MRLRLKKAENLGSSVVTRCLAALYDLLGLDDGYMHNWNREKRGVGKSLYD